VTEGNKKENIRDELERAGEALRSADLLCESRLYRDAVSRLYYQLYHTVRALLLSEGLEPKTHEGALRLLGMNFVKKGILTSGDSHVFSRLMKYREEADYNPTYVFTGADYIEFRKDAEGLCSKIRHYLEGKELLKG
jgi:uncharacterized protein (UPF0332 family)